ncbi:DUF948 domain-containing protein [Sporolactobacillus sp. THM19-2]|jgi:uncharacterized protein YoxC|uniref:DUF948 domain-containing protein n=1 Tax=Sporolactobacillus sp. THM19-2 TaxID=2511171 RepID=UPI0010212F14|nr:DUF948 domain-containing protein [Sporolactobacillus sp. THM19-2]RYL94558.1 DUF948 domain-containing protein [Sporolactobacillus sp. THM19-2]
MVIILYLAVAVIAVAFAVLVYFLAKTLQSAQKTMDDVASTLEDVQDQMKGLNEETTELLHRTNLLAGDIQQKSQSLSSIFNAVENFGESLNSVNASVKKVATSIENGGEENAGKVANALQWGRAAIDLIHRWKDKRADK